jgi:negative elongation factor C/D
MVHLMSVGFVLPVLDFMKGNCQMIDQALLRHFIGLLLSAIEAPYSSAFATAMVELLSVPKLEVRLPAPLPPLSPLSPLLSRYATMACRFADPPVLLCCRALPRVYD